MTNTTTTTISASFAFERETKNKVRFEEIVNAGATPVIGTLYVDKATVGDAKTVRITLDLA